ncbi:hypothetical protein CEXT_299221 [Caerostris extrusa]|uniref:Uncharacterized protein n=1 Tax=Caerostris extrusa TaxID=172846 RepID=A0AAV4SZU9_CAEEX|nr:hypothetical protein CEXT_299221 [Caerostris extrusa]
MIYSAALTVNLVKAKPFGLSMVACNISFPDVLRYTAKATQELLPAGFRWLSSSHTKDLAPSDSFMFPRLKEHLSGRRFSSDSAVKTSAESTSMDLISTKTG